MPWTLAKRRGKWCVVKKATGRPVPGGCHKSKEQARNHLVAIRVHTKE